MILKLLILLIYLTKIYVINCEPCKVSGQTMNCSDQGMVDCPDIQPDVTELIMDNNKLKDLKTVKCDKWKTLQIFSANNNRLVNLGHNILSSELTKIFVSHNQLEHVYIFGEKLTTVDLSHNKINDISIDRLESLNSLILAHNRIDETTLHNILYGNLLPMLSILDLSYNGLLKVPIAFMSFLPAYLYDVNLAGNKITVVYFTLFTYKSHRALKLNLSQNRISVLNLNMPPTLDYLDLSHNELPFIDLSSTKLLVTVPTIDISHNPFNCSCKYIPPFIVYINKHKDTFVHRTTTNCFSSKGPNIFHLNCKSFSSMVFLSHWKWIYPVVALIIVVLVIFGLVFVIRRRRKTYTKLGTADHCSGITYVSTVCSDWLRPSNQLTFNEPITSHHDFYIQDQNFGIDEKLIILCCSGDQTWVSNDIAVNLPMNKEIIHSRVSQLPTSEFILIIINDECSLKDSNLIKNVALTLQSTEMVEVRLLLRCIPREKSLKRKTRLNDYVTEKISTGAYFKFEDDYPLSCIDSLKAWLNLGA